MVRGNDSNKNDADGIAGRNANEIVARAHSVINDGDNDMGQKVD